MWNVLCDMSSMSIIWPPSRICVYDAASSFHFAGVVTCKGVAKGAGDRCEARDVMYIRYAMIAICFAVRYARHACDVRYGRDVRACTLCTLWTSCAVCILCARCTLCTARASNVLRRRQAAVVALARLRQLSTCKDKGSRYI